MKLLAAILSIFRPSNDCELLDHVPVGSGVAGAKLKRARKRAAEKHGKQFKCDVIKPRETPPSATLESLAALSKPETVIALPDNLVALKRSGGAK